MSLNWSCPYEELEAGQAFTTRGRTVTEADVVGFASLSPYKDRPAYSTTVVASSGSS